jgi:hypothetical protein
MRSPGMRIHGKRQMHYGADARDSASYRDDIDHTRHALQLDIPGKGMMAPWTLCMRHNTREEIVALSNATRLAPLGTKTNIDAVQTAHRLSQHS